MNHGTIKWLSEERGFGFITGESDGGDIFFRLSSIAGREGALPAAGQRVSYEIEKDPRGNYQLHAVHIRLQE